MQFRFNRYSSFYIFYGDKLLTTENPEEDTDRQLMQKLDLLPMQSS